MYEILRDDVVPMVLAALVEHVVQALVIRHRAHFEETGENALKQKYVRAVRSNVHAR